MCYLVSVAPTCLLRYKQTIFVPTEATVRPVSVVKREGAAVLQVTRVLNTDIVGGHWDNAATACIPLPLYEKKLSSLKAMVQSHGQLVEEDFQIKCYKWT